MKESKMTYIKRFSDILKEIENIGNKETTIYIDGENSILMSGRILKNIYNRNPTLRFSIRNTIKDFTIQDDKFYLDPNSYKFLKTCVTKYKKVIILVSNKNNSIVSFKGVEFMNVHDLIGDGMEESSLAVDFGYMSDRFLICSQTKKLHIFKIST
jgi:hypothetical protein